MDSNGKRCRCTYLLCSLSSESPFNLGCHKMSSPQKKRHSPGRGGKCNGTVESNYRSHPSVLYRGPNDVIYQDGGSSSLAVEAPTIAEADDESGWEIVPSFVIRSPDILLRAEKRREGRTSSSLIDLLPDICFKMDIFRRRIKSVAYWKDISTRKAVDVTKDDGF